MPAYKKSFTNEIQRRIEDGTLKVSSSFGSSSQDSVKSAVKKTVPGQTKAGKMNKTEVEYAQRLDALKACGEILWWAFESVKLRLADKTFYTPDFFVMRADGSLEVHETKGFMRDDANVKLKVANEIFPWAFFLVKKIPGGQWKITRVGNKNSF